MIGVTVGAFLIGILASIYLTERLMRPLSVLAQAVRRIAEGDLGGARARRGRDEIAQVAREFNAMAERLAEYRSSSLGELLQAQQASQAAIDSLPDPVLVLDSDGSVLNVNQAGETLLGISAESSDPLAGAAATVRGSSSACARTSCARAPTRRRGSRRRWRCRRAKGRATCCRGPIR